MPMRDCLSTEEDHVRRLSAMMMKVVQCGKPKKLLSLEFFFVKTACDVIN